MRLLNFFFAYLCAGALCYMALLSADNQTPTVSPIHSQKELPFRIQIKLVKDGKGEPFLFDRGLQSYAFAVYEDQLLFITGRTNGLHGFDNDSNNFPPRKQNRRVYVLDIKQKKLTSRSLEDPDAGLTQDQVDSLSVTSAEFYQQGNTLYIVGGYGFRHATDAFTTFDVLTAIDVPGLIQWVNHPHKHKKASHLIRQISDPLFKVTGGQMYQLREENPILLVFGQDFEGAYNPAQPDASVQIYTRQVRRFKIIDDGSHLAIKQLPSSNPEENYRRRDLNVIPVLKRSPNGKGLNYDLIALSGVFTMSGGAWTVPVTITEEGMPSMLDPMDPATFKQGMNNYASPFISLYSRQTDDAYMILLGGITFEYFQDGELQQDDELPFTNQVTTIKWNKKGRFTQHIMDATYPEILSTQSNPGNRLLFGASAAFIPAPGLEDLQYRNDIFKLDRICQPLVIGYIVGGIQSTVPNTTSRTDTAASPYIFKVILEPKE